MENQKLDDEDISFGKLNKIITLELDHSKNDLFNEINQFGEKYLNEIKQKDLRNESTKQKYIKWILKKKANYFTSDELNSYTFTDIKNIKKEVETDNKSKFLAIFKFLNPSE